MGRLAAAVSLFGIALAAALLGLMFAANEASKEGHIKGKVSVDLNNNPVETKPLQSFGSLMTFPQMKLYMWKSADSGVHSSPSIFALFNVSNDRICGTLHV